MARGAHLTRAFVLLAWAQCFISAGESRAVPLPFGLGAAASAEGAPNFEVKILARGTLEDVLPGGSAGLVPFPMVSARGDAFTCYRPPSAEGEEGEAAGDGESAAAEGAGAAEEMSPRLRAVVEMLASPERGCVERRFDFWSYRVCPGQSATQVHTGEVQPKAAGGGGTKSSVPSAASADRIEHDLGALVAGGAALVTSPSGALGFEQSFAGGTAGRAARVRYECEPVGMARDVDFDVVRVAEEPSHTYNILVGTRHAAFCDLLPSARRLLSFLNTTCLEHVEGWWTYELCLGVRLRQYHSDAGRMVQESVIGVYDWKFGEQVSKGQAMAGLPGVGVGEAGAAGTGAASGAPVASGAASAVVQRYHRGSPCDIRDNIPREALVRFECTPLGAGAEGAGAGAAAGAGMTAHQIALLGIQEAPSCVYTVRLGTPSVCAHPDVSPTTAVVTQAPPTDIFCVPDGEGEEEEDEEGRRGAGSDDGREGEGSTPSA
jgi:hypothetical protein